MGPGFEGSVLPLQVLAVTGIVLVGQGPLGNILLGTGRHRLVAFVSLGEAIANLVLSVLLVRRYGMLGVAIGTAVPVIAANLFVLRRRRAGRCSSGSRFRPHCRGRAVGLARSSLRSPASRSAQLVPPHSIPAIVVEGAVVGVST